ncbi:MAG: hypothetical protein AAF696_34510 [Bacteroidota bacterium]
MENKQLKYSSSSYEVSFNEEFPILLIICEQLGNFIGAKIQTYPPVLRKNLPSYAPKIFDLSILLNPGSLPLTIDAFYMGFLGSDSFLERENIYIKNNIISIPNNQENLYLKYSILHILENMGGKIELFGKEIYPKVDFPKWFFLKWEDPGIPAEFRLTSST